MGRRKAVAMALRKLGVVRNATGFALRLLCDRRRCEEHAGQDAVAMASKHDVPRVVRMGVRYEIKITCSAEKVVHNLAVGSKRKWARSFEIGIYPKGVASNSPGRAAHLWVKEIGDDLPQRGCISVKFKSMQPLWGTLDRNAKVPGCA